MGNSNSGVRHGHARKFHGKMSGAYSSWRSMISRCTHASVPGFTHYQARGITVCDRWRDSFEAFLADMGDRPEKHTIERIDNALGYAPGNCRWASRREQGNNRSTNVRVTYQGREFTMAELARHTGLGKEFLRHRITRAGWSVEEAVETPIWQGRRRDLEHQPSPAVR